MRRLNSEVRSNADLFENHVLVYVYKRNVTVDKLLYHMDAYPFLSALSAISGTSTFNKCAAEPRFTVVGHAKHNKTFLPAHNLFFNCTKITGKYTTVSFVKSVF